MATREAQGWREARRLCCSKDSGFSERSPEENESKAQEVMPLCSSLPTASLLLVITDQDLRDEMPGYPRGRAIIRRGNDWTTRFPEK